MRSLRTGKVLRQVRMFSCDKGHRIRGYGFFFFLIEEVLGFEPGSLGKLNIYCTTEKHFGLALIF